MQNWRKLKRDFGGFRKKGRRLFGILGNEAGIVNVPDRPGYQYARIERGAERVTLICKGNARPRLNTAVIIEQNAITGEFEIVGLDVETTRAAGDDPATALFNTEPHAASHEWRADADDILLWLHPLQMYFLRVQPGDTAGHVVVQGGPYFVEGKLHWKRAQSDLDLTGYYPGSGSVWVMVCLDGEGDFTIVQKAGGGHASDIEDLGPIPSGHVALAAVKLTFGAAFDFFNDFIPLWQVTQFDASVLSNGTVIIQDGTGMVINLAGNYPSILGEWFGLQQFTLAGKDFLALRAQWDSDFGAFGVIDEGFNRKDTVAVFGDDATGYADHFIVYGYGSWDGETYELRPMLTIDMNGAITPYTGGTFDGVDVSEHDHSGAGKGGTVDFTSLGDTPATYTGQGGKVVSVKSDETGLEFTTGGGGGGGGDVNITFQSQRWTVDGPLAVANEVGGVWRVPYDLSIYEVSIYLYNTGTAGSTIADFDVSSDGGVTWTTLFTTTGNRPAIAGGATDKRTTGIPDVTTLSAGDLVRMNIEQIGTGARGISGQIDAEVNSVTAANSMIIPIFTDITSGISTSSASYVEVMGGSSSRVTVFAFDFSKIPVAATVKLYARMRSDDASGTAYACLYNITADSIIAASETTRTGATTSLSVPSADFKSALPASLASFCVMIKTDGVYDAIISAAWLLVEW